MTKAPPLYSLIIALHPEQGGAHSEDWRIGDITIDWMDFAETTSPTALVDAVRDTLTLDAQGGSSSNDSRPPADAASSQALVALHAEGSPTRGASELGPGVIHLFKHPPPEHLSTEIALDESGEGEGGEGEGDDGGEEAEGADGTLVAVLAVPGWMRPADFVDYLGTWTTHLEGVRMIRDVSPNKTIVLLKFRARIHADDFIAANSGKAFSPLQNETCHALRIHHLILHTLQDPSSSLPSSRATSPVSRTQVLPAFPPSTYTSRNPPFLAALLKGIPPKTAYELPTCPVCLERMDSVVTGLITTPCAHVFHCSCLSKTRWSDSRCPVCRLSHLLLDQPDKAKRRDGAPEPALTTCAMCSEGERSRNNWMCVLCGAVGCSRYEKGHARQHFLDTGHVFSMEIDTQRVWDYVEDNYVHRLIQNRSDGKLVELPAAASLAAQDDDNDGGPGPSSSDEKKISKIEDITLEYSYLLTSQLEQQRKYFEAEIAQQTRQIVELQGQLGAAVAERSDALRTEYMNQLAELQQAKTKAEKKAETAIQVARRLQADLDAERSMSAGLVSKVKSLSSQVDASRGESLELRSKVDSLEEMVKDLMANFEMKQQLQAVEGAEGGDLMVARKKGGSKKR